LNQTLGLGSFSIEGIGFKDSRVEDLRKLNYTQHKKSFEPFNLLPLESFGSTELIN